MACSIQGGRRRPARLAAAALAALSTLATMACADDDGVVFGPGGDLNGTWAATTPEGTVYARITSNTVELYSPVDTCFQLVEFEIRGVDEGTLRLVPEGDTTSVTWAFERDGDVLNLDVGTTTLTLEPVDLDLSTLSVCGGSVGDFPHPPCSLIPPVVIGGTVTGRLEEGDTRWTDGTWYDLWSLQLESAATVTISLNADDPSVMDTYLMLYNAAATERIAQNDDVDSGAGNYNSRIRIELGPGCYIVVANSYSDSPEGAGGYSLTVSAQ
ncbi:MAG TPA: hypothetical protein VIL18_11390 [Longimicrobiales bacterium]